MVVIDRVVLAGAVIPEGEAACLPLEAAAMFRLRLDIKQIIEKTFTLAAGHPVEPGCVSAIYVE